MPATAPTCSGPDGSPGCCSPSPHLLRDHVLGLVVQDRDDRQIVEEDLLGLLKRCHARLRIGDADRVLHQLVELGVVVAGIVPHAGVRQEQVEEGDRIDIVADPGRARDVELLVVAGVEIDLPFLVIQRGIDADLLPHVLDRDRDLLVVLAGVVEELELQRLVRAVAGARPAAPWPWRCARPAACP